MPSENHFQAPDTAQVARAFSAKAHRYDTNAQIQQVLLDKLVLQVGKVNLDLGGPWLDYGCGTGLFAQKIAPLYLAASIFGCDIALESLKVAQQRHRYAGLLQTDVEQVPFKKNSFSATIMCSVLQWLKTPETALERMAALLKPRGYFLYAVFLQGSFQELYTLRSLYNLPVPVSFISGPSWDTAMNRSGLSPICSESFFFVKYFEDAWDVLASVSAIGGSATCGPRLSRGLLTAFCRKYEEKFGTSAGIPITYQAVIGIAQKGANA